MWTAATRTRALVHGQACESLPESCRTPPRAQIVFSKVASASCLQNGLERGQTEWEMVFGAFIVIQVRSQ